jgi:predicted lipid-binding transport protein (Tim44 family)
MKLFRPFLAALAVAAVFTMVVADADARPRVSAGSRGSKTFSAPPPTATAPNAAAPVNRTMTQPGTPGAAQTAARPPVQQPGGLFGGFGRGLAGGLLGGLLGAGLFGMLMGNGFLGGLAGFASIMGLLLQVALIGGIGFLLFRWWQRRSQPQPALAGMPRDAMNEPQQRTALGGFGFGGGDAAAPSIAPLEIKGEDFDIFERKLTEVQTAYSREDLATLRQHLTPEMLSYYSEELSENASRGVVNQISDVKLEQGDLAEAWSEGDKDYASVAMRYSLIDRYVDRATGKAAEGNDARQEATEVWTFQRTKGGGNWLVSAIQQA